MHTAFQVKPVLQWESMDFLIESFDTYSNKLIVGTNRGQLLVYEVKRPDEQPSLLHSRREFTSTKPIQQTAVVEDLNLLITLCDSTVFVHDLNDFSLRGRVDKTKGCLFFSIDVQVKGQPLVDTHRSRRDRRRSWADINLRLCAVMKRKVVLFDWVSNPRMSEFVETKEYQLPDTPIKVAWSGSNLLVGLKREYNLIDANGNIKFLFRNGTQDPVIARIPGNEFVLQSEENYGILVKLSGEPSRQYAINWTVPPIALDVSGCYLVSLSPGILEVRDTEKFEPVQRLELPKARFMAQNDMLLVASTVNLWRILPVPLEQQIEAHLAKEQFDAALKLAELIEEPPESKRQRIFRISRAKAYALFIRRQFAAAMDEFAKLEEISPPQVIALYPELLPEKLRDQITHPVPIPPLEEEKKEAAYTALIQYLTAKRTLMSKEAPALDDAVRRERAELGAIVDTNLLKCYIKVKPAMVKYLLQTNNQCSLDESEKILKDSSRYQELVMLYKNRQMHRRALETLVKHGSRLGQGGNKELSLVDYLQHLPPDQIDLRCEFTEKMFKDSPNDAFSVFTADEPDVQAQPRGVVLKFLKRTSPEHVIPYLEHIIMKWNDITPDFHNELETAYLEAVQRPMQEYLASLKGRKAAPPGSEPGPLGPARRRLLEFSRASMHYEPEKMLSRFFGIEGLYEERALLLGRIGRHEQAIAMFALKIQDFDQAEEYCQRVFETDTESGRHVFLSLLKCYLAPEDGYPVNLDAAFSIIQKYHDRLDTQRVLEMLPTNTKIVDVREFLVGCLRQRAAVRRDVSVLRNLNKKEHLQITRELLEIHAQPIEIHEDSYCYVCRALLRTSAFVRYPNGIICHLSCSPNQDLCPCDSPQCTLKHRGSSTASINP
eukprot:m.181586 g.181586  ORF g.181586 m.181586 type:complete len:887 (-) comp17442_c1_seq3:450-3110(-)